MSKTKSYFIALSIIIGLVHVMLVLSYGTQKEGFHEDEYFTYWSSSSSVPITIRQNYSWHSGHELMSRFFVNPEERFDFKSVVKNQAEDVHPPLYYLTLNVFMSLFAGRFYKWFGILLNLLYSLVTYVGIIIFFYRLDRSENRYFLSLLAGLSFSIAPSAVSNCMLARMYVMSGMWTILYANVFLFLMQNYNCNWRKYMQIVIAGASICYLAFLTHYFSLLIPFGLTLFYCVYVVCRRKGVAKMLVYGCSMLTAIVLAVITYPASIRHIFFEYRGTGAIEGLTASDFGGRLQVFLPLLDQYIFAGIMWVLFALMGASLVIGGAILVWRRVKKLPNPTTEISVLAASIGSCVFGMWFLFRTALMAGPASTRYFFPVTLFVLSLIAYSIGKVICCFRFIKIGVLQRNLTWGVLAVILTVPSVLGYLQGNVLFLYRDEVDKKAYSEEYSQYPALMLVSMDAPYRSWYVDDQLWPFEAVFYVDYEHIMADFEDERLFTAEKLIVYMDAPTDVLDKLIENNPNLSSYTLARHDPFFYIYLLE